MQGNCRKPIVSVVVPCRNERTHIETCVRSILAQQPPPGGFEIIVADGLSDDGSREILDHLARSEARLEVVDNPERLTASGMNAGIRRAGGQYIAIMGAHNRYAPDYLRCAVEVLEETGADNVGGSMRCEGHSRLQRAIARAHHSPFAIGGARWHDPNYEGPADTVFGGVYRREVFERIGLLDEELVRNQDDEFNLRLMRAGGKIWHSRRIRSWYTPRDSLKALFEQYFQYGYWKVLVIQKHRVPASVRHLVPAGFVLSLAMLSVASFVWTPTLWVLSGLIGSYLLCNLTASMLAARNGGLRLFSLLPLVFATYHFAYGLGFLQGIWDFLILRRGARRAFSKLTRSPARANNVKAKSPTG